MEADASKLLQQLPRDLDVQLMECSSSSLHDQTVDKCQQVKMWQQSHYLPDSGIHTGLGTNTPSISSKVGIDDGDSDERFVGQKPQCFTQWPSFPMSVNPNDSALLSPATPSTGSVMGLDNFGDTPGGSQSASNVDLRGNRLPDIDTDEAATAVPELVKLIKDEDDQVIIYQSSMMVFQLSKSEAIDALIKSMDMIECIISALARTDDPETVRFLSGTLYNISQTQTGLQAIFAAHCVPCLVNLLNSPIESVLFYAITTLHNLLLHQDGAKNVVRQSGCLQKMTSLLRKNNIKFLTICTDCLQILAYGHQESKLQILSSGGPTELIRILRSYQYEKLLWTTARVLKVLSVCSSNKPAIVAAGGMDALAKHLHNSSRRLVINCLWALRNLSDAATRLDNLHPLLHSLVQLLDCGDTNMVTCAAGILSNLTCNNHTNKFIVHKLGGIQGLLRAVAQVGAKEDVLEPCMCALRHLTSRHEEEETARYAVVHELGGLPVLARILHAATAGICPDLGLVCQTPQNPVTSWMLIKAMVGLLRNLSVNIDSHHGMREYGLVTGLFLLLCATQHEITKRANLNGSTSIQPFATMVQNVRLEEIVEGICGALHMLAKDHSTRSYLATLKTPNLVINSRVQPGCSSLTIFVHFLFSPHESIQRAAAGVLAELSLDRDGLEALTNLPWASVRFDELVHSRNEAISTYASAVVIRLTEERKGCLSNSGVFPPQVETLSTPPLPPDNTRSFQSPGSHQPPTLPPPCSPLVSTPTVTPSNKQTWSHQLPQEQANAVPSPTPHSLTEMLGPPPTVYKGTTCSNYGSYWNSDCSSGCDAPCSAYPDQCVSNFCCLAVSCPYPTAHGHPRLEMPYGPGCPQLGVAPYVSIPSHVISPPSHLSPQVPTVISDAASFTSFGSTSARRSGFGSLDTSGYISPSNELYAQRSPTTYKTQLPSSAVRRISRTLGPNSQLQAAGRNHSSAVPPHQHSGGYLSPELMSLDEPSRDWLPSAL